MLKPSARSVIRPQDGFQMKFLSSPADIVIGGSAAGVGKTASLLLEFMRNYRVKGWDGVIFRRTIPQIKAPGALWDTSHQFYAPAGAIPRETMLEWKFGDRSKIKFSHLEYEKNIYDWQGAQIPYIGFDELTHFTSKMFFYLLSRNRSSCGVRPYVRAVCNPDPDSWVAEFVEWWIDQETGYPIPERDGVLRYMLMDGQNVIWGDSIDEVREKGAYLLEPMIAETKARPEDLILSVTFISGKISDNKILLSQNPGYYANLLAQDEQTKAQLLHGNWKTVITENELYQHPAFLGMFHNTYNVQNSNRYITADIALKGSDKFVVYVWYGYELVDLVIMDRSDGKQVVDAIKEMAAKHRVPNSNIIYDSDGVGGFVDGYIEGAISFHNGAAAENGENYQNLKTQCYYKSADRVNSGGYRVAEEVAGRMYDNRNTIRQRLITERRAIKRDKADSDGKLKIIPKEKMKALISNTSPDLMDAFMMREYPELVPQVNHNWARAFNKNR